MRLDVIGALSLTELLCQIRLSRAYTLLLVPFVAEFLARSASMSFSPKGTLYICQSPLFNLVSNYTTGQQVRDACWLRTGIRFGLTG